MESVEWRERIHTDAKILSGKPVVKGTRLSVEFLLRLFAAGWSREEVLENYPSLKEEDLAAIFDYAAEVASEERGFMLRR